MTDAVGLQLSRLVERTLPELLSFVVDNRGRTCPTSDRGFPLIATNCIKPGRRDAVLEKVRYVDHATYSGWFRSHPQPGDVIFVCKGSPGRTAIVPDPVPYCIAQDMVALRANSEVIVPLYLYYRLSAPDVQAKIASMHVGTLIPHFKKGDFGKLRFSVHEDLDEQRRIAGVLGALDDLIDSNRRMAAQLEDLFVASWRSASKKCTLERPLGEVFDLRKGLSYKGAFLADQGVPLVNLANFGLDGSFVESGTKYYVGPIKESQRLVKGDLVIANTDLTQKRDILARPVLVPFEDASSTHHTYQMITRGGDAMRGWVYGALRNETIRRRLISFATGTTVAALPADAVLTQEVPWQEDVIESWWRPASSLLAAKEAVEVEALDASRIRDQLLPLLMSGLVRVDELAG